MNEFFTKHSYIRGYINDDEVLFKNQALKKNTI